MQRIKIVAICLAALLLVGVDPDQATALAIAVVGGLLVVAIESLIG